MSPSSTHSWQRWEPDAFDAPRENATAAQSAANSAAGDLTATSEAARAAGYEAGFEAGRRDGLQAGREAAEAESRALAQQLGDAILRFDQGVARLEQDVAQQLLNLAMSIARRVVGETLEAQPDAILATIREALAQLPAQHAVIHLNGEDAELIRSQMGDSLGRAGHRLIENPQLARGDVLVEAGGTQVDARLATRWQRVWDSLEPEPAARSQA